MYIVSLFKKSSIWFYHIFCTVIVFTVALHYLEYILVAVSKIYFMPKKFALPLEVVPIYLNGSSCN